MSAQTKTMTFAAFDPGYTTGFAAGIYYPDAMEFRFKDLEPINLRFGDPHFKLTNPGVDKLLRYREEVFNKLDAFDIPTNNVLHTAVEDFKGGLGGDIQNTVNKLIGVTLATIAELRDIAIADVEQPSLGETTEGPSVAEPRLYANVARKRFLPLADKIIEAHRRNPVFAPIHAEDGRHSRDAMGHLLKRVEEVVGEETFKRIRWV